MKITTKAKMLACLLTMVSIYVYSHGLPVLHVARYNALQAVLDDAVRASKGDK